MDRNCLFADVYDYIFNDSESNNSLKTVVKALIISSSFVGMAGNILICYVILSNEHMRTTTNYYLFSLAVSDGLQAVSLICSTVYAEAVSYFSSEMPMVYILITFVYILTSCSSIAVALAFTVDRYIAVCHPFHGRTMFTLSRTVYTIVALWTVVGIYSFGMAFCGDLQEGFCNKLFFLFSVDLYSLLFFLIPMILNLVLYLLIGIKVFQSSRLFASINTQATARSSQNFSRSLKMSVAVIAECCICWAPMHVFSLMHKHYQPFRIDDQGGVFILFAYLVYLLSTIINPVVYSIMSKAFRKSLKVALCSKGGIPRYLSVKRAATGSSDAHTETTT